MHWWNDVHAFVMAEAASGCFVSLGRRDACGQFVNRERLYDLSPQFMAEYGSRLEKWLLEIAEDLYDLS
jgi:hypothetical protein